MIQRWTVAGRRPIGLLGLLLVLGLLGHLYDGLAETPHTDVTAIPVPARSTPELPSTTPSGDPILVGAGDIASCSSDNDEATARLLDGIGGTIFTLGDNVYSDGTAKQFADCYNPTWGRHKHRTRPASGNHDYHTDAAAGYFGYFGAVAGNPTEGWYSYDLGDWHIVVLNSNCGDVGGCDSGSPQERWLRADLASNPALCTLAYWHHPRFSSGEHGDDKNVSAFWEALYDAGADVVLSGHDHHYERFAPQDPDGRNDSERGIVSFVVGTGGRSLRDSDDTKRNSVVRDSETYGVIELTLRPDGYGWRFVPVEGQTFTDVGSGACH
ncbi:MAG: acid phosphatase type 7 [Thermomicrobiales bacterium]|nr:acid phosphatase type 7 [Thermomicrobiales bacterium]